MKLNLLELKIKLVKECENYAKHLILDIIYQNPKSQFNSPEFIADTYLLTEKFSLPDDRLSQISSYDHQELDTTSKRVLLAEYKLVLICKLLNTLPEKLDSPKNFDEFASYFHREVRKEIEQLRRNDTTVDMYLVPFLKAITGILFCFTIILAPLAYYGLYKTTGSNTGDKLTDLLREIYDEPKHMQSIKP